MLDFQVSQFPFRLGLSEGQDPHQVPPGTLTEAENAVWRQGGRLEKRFGTRALLASIIGGGSIAACSRLFTRGSELCVVDGTTLYAYSPATPGWTATPTTGAMSDAGLTWQKLLDAAQGAQVSDLAVDSNGLAFHAWVTGDPASPGGSLFYQIIDTATGNLLTPPTNITTSVSFLRVLVSGTTFVLLYSDGTNIKSRVGSTTTTLRSDAAGTGHFDACLLGSNFAIAYVKATGITLYSYSVATTPVQQATGTVTGEAGAVRCVSIDGSTSDNLWIAYATTATAMRYAVAHPTTLAQTLAPTNIDTVATQINQAVGVMRYDSTTCIIAMYSESGSLPNGYQDGELRTCRASTAGALTFTRSTNYARLMSRPFTLSGRVYLFAANPMSPAGLSSGSAAASLVDTHLFEVELSAGQTHRYVGHVDVLSGGNWARYYCANVATVSATSVLFGMPFQSAISSSFVGTRQGVNLVRALSGASVPTDMWRSCTVGQEAYLAAGVLMAYDGARAFDYGFAHPSYIDGSTATVNAGGSQVTGSYLYSTVPEFRSMAGMLHRGPTAPAYTVAVTGPSGTTTLSLVPQRISSKTTVTQWGTSTDPARSLIAIYRSVVNGTVLQRLTVDPTYTTLFNSYTPTPMTIADTAADASTGSGAPALASRPAIYTTGGILDDYAPPASVTMFHHADRLWVLAGDQRTWWYSKAFQDDAGVAPGFHPNFRIVFDTQQVAGATMDDKAIFFGADSVRYMLGTGPAPNGQNSDFTTPVAIQSDVGCNNARSVVGTPDGVMFGSDRGIYLLTRGLELVWIGRPVKDKLATYPTITSAVLVPKQNHVRFTCNNTSGTAGVVLVYDYVEKQWSTFKYWINGAYGNPIADACMWNGAYTFASAVGTVYSESTSSYLDDNNTYYVPMTLETAWVSAAGPLSFQSVRTLQLSGTSYSDHGLSISVGFDNDTSYPQVATWLSQSAVTTIGDEAPSVTVGTRRKCNTIRFKIVDAQPTVGVPGSGRGPAWNMLGMEVGIKRGLGNAPATKKA